jgi:hypothetical protein
MWSGRIHKVSMAMIDGPHVFEVHALTGIQTIFLQSRARLTKYPVSNVNGRNTTVHNVNRRLYGRTLSDSLDITILKHTSLHSFRRKPSETVVLQHRGDENRDP